MLASPLARAGAEPFGEAFDGWKFTQENVGQSILCRAVHNNQYVLGKQTNRRVHISFPNNIINGTDTHASLAVGTESEIITASGNGTRLILSNIPEAVFDAIGPERGFTWRAASKGKVEQGIVKLNDSTTSAIERLDECLDANSSKGAAGRDVTTPTRIKFAKRAISATVTGKLTGFDSEQRYVIAVGKGQTMTVEQLNPANQRTTLGITAPNGTDVSDMDLSCNNRKQVSPTSAGDYTISVSECMKADEWNGSYSLKVTVK
jgi:hypothetical protein